MSFDPYESLPSREDIKKSGAEDWITDAFKKQKQEQDALLAALGGETDKLKAEKKGLEGLLELPPETPEDDEYTPDIFAAERESAQKKKNALSGLVGDLEKSKAAEKEMLKNLFGNP